MGPPLDTFALFSGVLGGLSLFLFGMDRMAESLKQLAGDRMKKILARLTENRFMGLLTGAIVTAVIQSSSVTTVLVVGFVAGGVISLSQAMGVILGADIGTTLTVQLIAFNVTRYALLVVTLGFGLTIFRKWDGSRVYGGFLMGIGLVFYGMGLMSTSMIPVRENPVFLNLLAAMEHPLAAVGVAALFTAAIHSSSATIGLVVVLASQGLITLETGIALSLGANIGTCATAGLAAIGKPREAVQAALAHVLFKVIGTLAVLPFIPALAHLVLLVSPNAAPGTDGAAAQALVVPRQIANAHTIFNVGIAACFLPLAGTFASLLEWMVPKKAGAEEEEIGEPLYLDESLLAVPSLALGQARLEAGRMGNLLLRMFEEGSQAIRKVDRELMHHARAMDDAVDSLYDRISEYLAGISRTPLTEAQSLEVMQAMSAVGNLEAIGDLIETNLSHVVDTAASLGIAFGQDVVEDFGRLFLLVHEGLRAAIDALAWNDHKLARKVFALKPKMDDLDTELKRKHLARLRDAPPGERQVHTLEMSIIEYLKRIHYHSRRVAKRVLDSPSQ
jgi:phosphate:Na+ symporter